MFITPLPRQSLPASPDEELIRGYRREGDPQLFAELFGRYAAVIYRLCSRYLHNEEDRRDTVMRIFEKCLRHISTREVHRFSNWLCLLARNECIDQLRALEKQSEGSIIYQQQMALCRQYRADQSALETRLVHLMEKLSEQQRICLKLFFYENKSYLEISRVTGFTEKKVKSHLQNGKRRLRILLEKEMKGENDET